MQGYSSKDRKGSLFDAWDLSEAGGVELSEVPLSFFLHRNFH
jgi:homeobox protein cut-like